MRCLLAMSASWPLLACSPDQQTSPQESCLPYGPRTVTLSGKAVTRMFPAAPDSKSLDDGDAAENVLLLQLDAPICVSAATGVDGNAVEERGIREIQLLPQSSYKAAYSLSGLRVTATGPLFHAQTGHHHTRVLMTLQRIRPE